MAKKVLVKPLISEKAETLSNELNQVTFIVNKLANKIEIKKAVEAFYGVTVAKVNTAIMPARESTRFTKAGLQRSRVSSYKKAIVTLDEGDEIDFFDEI